MASNLLDTVRGYVTPDLLENASSHLGESSSGIKKAVNAAIPAVLAMFINRSEKGDSQGLYDDAIQAANSNVLDDRERLFKDGIGSVIPGEKEEIIGDSVNKSSSPASVIASFAGIKAGTVERLLSMIAPLALAALGRHVKENNITSSGFASFLSGQKDAVRNALPAGLSVDDTFGKRTEPHLEREETLSTSDDREEVTTIDDEPRKKTNWVPLLLLGLGLVALIWFLTRDRGETDTPISNADTTSSATYDTNTSASTAANTSREATKVRLADGTELNAYRGGVEDQLVACLNDAGCEAGKDQWYDFDNINFEVGSAKLTAESQEQVKNIAAILKAYPDAKIKIGGYTDKTGDDAANQKLSQQRAESVLAAIKDAGANQNQLSGAEGYGSQFAKVDSTASDDERKKDRRIAVQLRDK